MLTYVILGAQPSILDVFITTSLVSNG